jgi:hypothetical protein
MTASITPSLKFISLQQRITSSNRTEFTANNLPTWEIKLIRLEKKVAAWILALRKRSIRQLSAASQNFLSSFPTGWGEGGIFST